LQRDKTNSMPDVILPTPWAWQANKGRLVYLVLFVVFFMAFMKETCGGSCQEKNHLRTAFAVIRFCSFLLAMFLHRKAPAAFLAVMLNAVMAWSSVLTETSAYHRTGMIYLHHSIWKVWPTCISCTKRHVILITGMSYAIDLVALALSDKLHGDQFSVPCAMWFGFSTFVYCRISLFNQTQFHTLRCTQELVKSKKKACETLISMLCDGLVWVADDGETVIKKERLCDLMGYTGLEKLSYLVTSGFDALHSSDEVDRLRDAIQHSKNGPVLFHTTGQCRDGAFRGVDFFIVRQEEIFTGEEECGPDCRHGFLIGLRLQSQFACYPTSNPLCTIADADEPGDEPMVDIPPCPEVCIPVLHEDGDVLETHMSVSTNSSAVFQRLDDMKDMVESMVHLEKLGCKEHWLIAPQHLEVCPEQVLGRGGFGVVMAGFLHGTSVAIKVPSSTTVKSAMNALINEIRILRRCRHPNIVLFHGVSIVAGENQLAMVFDQVPGKTMESFVRKPPCSPSALERHCLVLDICEALRYLHGLDPQVVHGDVKATNIMVDGVTYARPCAKMLDFGLSRLVTGRANLSGGTLRWMAPEVITGTRPHTSADVFSFGQLVAFIMSGQRPCPGKQATTIRTMACRGETSITVPNGSCYEEACRDLCKQCCAFRASERPSIAFAHVEILTWTTQSAGAKMRTACTPTEDAGKDDLENHAMMQHCIMEL